MQEVWVAYRGAKFRLESVGEGLERLLRGCLSRWEEDKTGLSRLFYAW